MIEFSILIMVNKTASTQIAVHRCHSGLFLCAGQRQYHLKLRKNIFYLEQVIKIEISHIDSLPKLGTYLHCKILDIDEDHPWLRQLPKI